MSSLDGGCWDRTSGVSDLISWIFHDLQNNLQVLARGVTKQSQQMLALSFHPDPSPTAVGGLSWMFTPASQGRHSYLPRRREGVLLHLVLDRKKN